MIDVGLTAAVISAAVAIVSLGVTIYIQMKIDKRDEKRHAEQVDIEASKFIQRHNTADRYMSDMLFLTQCVYARKFDPLHLYEREIYNDFCCQPEDVRNRILERYGIEPVKDEVDFSTRIIKKIQDIVATYCPGDQDIFYEGAKYLTRALYHHGGEDTPELSCAEDRYRQEEKKTAAGALIGKTKEMPFEQHVTNLLAYEPNARPISRLFQEQTSQGSANSGDEIIASYLCCLVAKFAAIYANKGIDDSRFSDFADYVGEKTMEDLFLTTLAYADACDIDQIRKDKKKTK